MSALFHFLGSRARARRTSISHAVTEACRRGAGPLLIRARAVLCVAANLWISGARAVLCSRAALNADLLCASNDGCVFAYVASQPSECIEREALIAGVI